EATAALPPHEVRALAEAEAIRASSGANAAQSEANFRQLTARAERFVKVLEAGLQENPTEDALGTVSRARALLEEARSLIGVTDTQALAQRAAIGRQLAILVGARSDSSHSVALNADRTAYIRGGLMTAPHQQLKHEEPELR